MADYPWKNWLGDEPKIDPETRRPTVVTPMRSPRPVGGGAAREINPELDINLGGGARMIGRTPTYAKGGFVTPPASGGMPSKYGSSTHVACSDNKKVR